MKTALWALMVLALLSAGCHRSLPTPSAPDVPANPVAAALERAEHFLLDHQSADGTWRSERYGQFRDGSALTPLVLQALLAMPSTPPRDAALTKGADFLAGLARADGSIATDAFGLPYAVYTASGAIEVLSRWQPTEHRHACAVWLAYLRARQLTEDLGWQRDDWQYGGWGYCPVVPRKPRPGELAPLHLESNLSATLFALSALHGAHVPAADPAYRRARIFVERCQNHASADGVRDPRFDDGGFFFIEHDAVRNKAGAAGTDPAGRERYRSYPSATADGLRALILCGVPVADPRVVRARAWLDDNVGTQIAPRSALVRETAFFYFAWSASAATDAPRPAALAEELLHRQQPDGSWANTIVLVLEDEPLVATSFAILALTAARRE